MDIDSVAEMLMDVFEKFASKQPKYLRRIRIVIFDVKHTQTFARQVVKCIRAFEKKQHSGGFFDKIGRIGRFITGISDMHAANQEITGLDGVKLNQR